jgi:hypothetical protein
MLIVILIFLLNLKGLREIEGMTVSEKHRSIHFRMVLLLTFVFILSQLTHIFYRKEGPTAEIVFILMEPIIYLFSNDYRDGAVCGVAFMTMSVLCYITSAFPLILALGIMERKHSIILVVLFVGAMAELITGIYLRDHLSRSVFVLVGSLMCIVFTMNAEWVNSIRWLYILYVIKLYLNGDI